MSFSPLPLSSFARHLSTLSRQSRHYYVPPSRSESSTSLKDKKKHFISFEKLNLSDYRVLGWHGTGSSSAHNIITNGVQGNFFVATDVDSARGYARTTAIKKLEEPKVLLVATKKGTHLETATNVYGADYFTPQASNKLVVIAVLSEGEIVKISRDSNHPLAKHVGQLRPLEK